MTYTYIDSCPHCGRLHTPVIIWIDGRQALCCPDKIYKPFETDNTHKRYIIQNKEMNNEIAAS